MKKDTKNTLDYSAFDKSWWWAFRKGLKTWSTFTYIMALISLFFLVVMTVIVIFFDTPIYTDKPETRLTIWGYVLAADIIGFIAVIVLFFFSKPDKIKLRYFAKRNNLHLSKTGISTRKNEDILGKSILNDLVNKNNISSQSHMWTDNRIEGLPGFRLFEYVINRGVVNKKLVVLKTFVDRKSPHIVLDTNANGYINLASQLSKEEQFWSRFKQVELEGDFQKHYKLLISKDVEDPRDILQIFTPDVMAMLIDSNAALDVEIYDGEVYLYSEAMSLYMKSNIQFLIYTAGKLLPVINKALHQTKLTEAVLQSNKLS